MSRLSARPCIMWDKTKPVHQLTVWLLGNNSQKSYTTITVMFSFRDIIQSNNTRYQIIKPWKSCSQKGCLHCKALSPTIHNKWHQVLSQQPKILPWHPWNSWEKWHNMPFRHHKKKKKPITVTPNKQRGYKFGSPQITHLLRCHIQPVLDIFPKGCWKSVRLKQQPLPNLS